MNDPWEEIRANIARKRNAKKGVRNDNISDMSPENVKKINSMVMSQYNNIDKTYVSPDYMNNKELSQGNPIRQFLGDIITNTQSTLDYSEPTPISEYPMQVLRKALGLSPKLMGKSVRNTRLEDLMLTPDTSIMEDEMYPGARGEDFLFRKAFDLPPRFLTGGIFNPAGDKKWQFNSEDVTGKYYADEIQWLHDQFVKKGENPMKHNVLNWFNFEPISTGYDPEKKKYYVESQYSDPYDVALNPGESVGNDIGVGPGFDIKLPKYTNLLRFLANKVMDPQTVVGTVRSYTDEKPNIKVKKKKPVGAVKESYNLYNTPE